MTAGELEHVYFEWLYRLVCDDRYGVSDRTSYRRLLSYLHEEPFQYENKHPHDEARARDGIDLRYEFGYQERIPEIVIAQELDTRKCSVLEMMVALCRRCEDTAFDPRIGDRLGQWFWGMLDSLGLAGMNDHDYDTRTAQDILSDFQNNNYAHNGEGGLFTLHGTDEDVRDHELIWQMMHYLNEHGF